MPWFELIISWLFFLFLRSKISCLQALAFRITLSDYSILLRTSIHSRHRQSRACQILPFEKPSTRRIEGRTRNCLLCCVQAFGLGTGSNRVLAKYYRSKSHPQGESKEGIAYSERKKSLGEGSLAENKETGRCVCYFVSYFMILMLMNSSLSYYRRYHPL